MGECICNSCRNLKRVVDDEGEAGEYVCEHGFPSKDCENCSGDDCELTCSNYLSDEQEDQPRTVACKACGKELTTVMDDMDESEIYCMDCYLNKK